MFWLGFGLGFFAAAGLAIFLCIVSVTEATVNPDYPTPDD